MRHPLHSCTNLSDGFMAASDHIKDFGEHLVEISTKIAFFVLFTASSM